jgi:hypothetical protein
MILLLVGLSSAATPTQAAAPDASNPRTVTDEFYSWYIQYGRTHPVAGHPFITRDLAQRIEASQGAGFDPVLCAQNIPHGISTAPAHVEGNRASVTVHLHFDGPAPAVTAHLLRFEGLHGIVTWKINDITCGAPPAPAMTAPQQVTQAFYEWYIAYNQVPGQHALNDGTYRDYPYLTEAFKERLEASRGAGYDPVLCAQDIPARVSTDPAHITGDTASVTVRLHFGGSERHIIARVIRDPAADIWYIDDLACGH